MLSSRFSNIRTTVRALTTNNVSSSPLRCTTIINSQRMYATANQAPYFIEVPELKTKLESNENIKLIDTRSPDVFDETHIPGAVNIHDCFTYLSMSDEQSLKDLQEHFRDLFGKAGITGNEHVVTYEEGLSSGFAQSCRAWFLLKYMGHPKASVLNGGLDAWRTSDGSVTGEASVIDPVQFNCEVNSEWMATKEDVLKALGPNGAKKLLDVRDADEWIGESSSPYGKDFCPRKGRLEGASWIEWYDLMEKQEDGVTKIKPSDKVAAALKAQGITKEDDIIVYCFKGSRASNTLMLLKEAGFDKSTNYFASWNEWSRDESLPIDDKVLSS